MVLHMCKIAVGKVLAYAAVSQYAIFVGLCAGIMVHLQKRDFTGTITLTIKEKISTRCLSKTLVPGSKEKGSTQGQFTELLERIV